MKIFKDSNDDTCLAESAPNGWVEITQQELDAIREFRRVSNIPALAPLTPRQIRQAMTALGLRAEVEAAIASSSQDLKDWWEFAQSFERNHPMVVGMGQALGKTPAELDALFTLGATL